MPSAVLSKRVAKLNMEFENHQNQLCEAIVQTICVNILERLASIVSR